jgi:hypothetical protein
VSWLTDTYNVKGLKRQIGTFLKSGKTKNVKNWKQLFDFIAIDLQVQRPLFYIFKPNLMRPLNLFQVEHYPRYKNGQFFTMNISLTIRDGRIFEIPLERVQKGNLRSFFPKCPLSL